MPEKDLRYLEFDLGKKKLFIVKHHSVVLKCWRKAFEEKVITNNSTLFHIDKHPDFCFDEKNKDKSIQLLTLNENEINIFIKEDLAFDNSEFIVNAMFGSLVKDAISIHFDDHHQYGKFIEKNYSTTGKLYFLEQEVEHNFYIYNSQSVEDLFGRQSLLEDTCIHQDTKKLFSESKSLILDIDLDFFTYGCDKTYAKNRKDIKNQLTSNSFQNLFNKSKIITIALEPDYCGSNEDCFEILEIFNEYIFKPEGLDILTEVKEFFSV